MPPEKVVVFLFCLLRYHRIAQSVGCLLHKFKNLESLPKSPHKSWTEQCVSITPILGAERQMDPQSLLAVSLSQSVSPMLSERYCLKKQDKEQLKYLCGSLAFIQYAYVCKCTPIHICLLKKTYTHIHHSHI